MDCVYSLEQPHWGAEVRGGLVIESLTPEREVEDSTPTSAVSCLRANTHLLLEKYW